MDTETGELQERRLQHREEAEKFYRELAAQGRKVRVGMEASGHARWFERLLSELQFELWVTTCRLAKSPYATLYTGGSGGFVASTAAPIATGWSDPVPGRVYLPLWFSAFSRRTVIAFYEKVIKVKADVAAFLS